MASRGTGQGPWEYYISAPWQSYLTSLGLRFIYKIGFGSNETKFAKWLA